MKLAKKTATILILLYIGLFAPVLPSLSALKTAHAAVGYATDGLSVTTGSGLTHFSYSQLADDQRTRILSTSSGLDATFTVESVTLGSANMIYVYYDGHVSNATLTYQVQIRDFQNSVWRNMVPHDTTLANTTDSAAGLVGNAFVVYDGFFTNGSGTPVSTPMSNFVNGSNQAQIRFFSAASSAAMELRVDYLAVEPAIENIRYPASRVNNAGGTETNEYNDLTTDDNTTNSTIAANGSGINVEYVFTGLPTAYTGANSLFIEYSGADDAALSDYSVSIRDYAAGAGQWDTLNGTILNSASDTTHNFASSTQQAVGDYINSGEVRIRFTSSDTSGTLTLDYLRVTLGSTSSNTGVYVEEISRGTSSSGTADNTRNVDTTTAASTRVIASSTSDVTATTQYPNDCNAATNNCFGYNLKFPVTVPSGQQVTGVHAVARYNSSVTTNDVEWGIRNRWNGNIAMNASGDLTTANTNFRTAAYPIPPQIGSLPISTQTALFEPEYYVDTIDDALTLYFRSNAPTTSGNLTVDYAFVSIRTINGKGSITNAFTPTGATLTNGTNNASNFRFANRDDANYYSVTQNGTTGTDFYLSFSKVEIPTGANKFIVDARVRTAATATINYDMYLYDFTAATWRKITPHEAVIASENNTEEIVQIEVYDGYFSNGSDAPVDLALSDFVSSQEMRLRFVSTNTANRIELDWVNIEIAKDPAYYPADSTITNGTISNEYNDTTTDDATTSYTVANSGGIDFYFSFLNVNTPPTGSNAAFFIVSSHMVAGATSYNISIRNFNTASWQPINGTVLSHTTDRTDYFIFSISNWSDYISNGEMRLRFNSAAAGGSIVVDQVKMTLGSVNTNTSGSSFEFGGDYRNTVADSRDTDTSSTLDFGNDTWGVRSFPNAQNGTTQEAPANIAFTVDFPVALPSGAYPSAVLWATKGQSSLTTVTPQVSIYNDKNATRAATNNKATMTTLSAIPNAVDGIIYNIASETFREGWYIENVTNALNFIDNEVSMRFRTTASTNLGVHIFNLDSLFVALRYVD